MFLDTELIINPDGSIYHLCLKPHQIADTVITVGDPDRVAEVSKHFDKIEHIVTHREFVTHTGYLKNKRLSVISTGIGTDNIDIVLNELDALVNIDFRTRTLKEKLTSLQIIRIGTSGALQKDIAVDTLVISEFALAIDGLMCFYDFKISKKENKTLSDLQDYARRSDLNFPLPIQIFEGSERLIATINSDKIFTSGITATCTGFYAPQGRTLRAMSQNIDYLNKLSEFRTSDNLRITNLEMETSGIYGLSKVLGHQAVSCNAILANRMTGEFSANPNAVVENLIALVLNRIT